MALTRREKIYKFLKVNRGYVPLALIYDQLRAKTESQKASVRIMLCKGLDKQFERHPEHNGLYKAK